MAASQTQQTASYSNPLDLFYEYIDDVTSERVPTCKYTKLAVQRHLTDVKEADNWGIYFDEDEANRRLKFIKTLRHTKGKFARQPFRLKPFQAFITGSIFGWKYIETQLRRFASAYIEMARKGAKTELLGAWELSCLLQDGEYGADIFSAATKKDQAKKAFDAARTMALMLTSDSPRIARLVNILSYSISVPSTNSRLWYLGADHDKMDGENPHMAGIDEYHAHKTNGVRKVITTGMGERAQPLETVITTAGFNQNGPCYKNLRPACIAILEGRSVDLSQFAIIFTLDDDDDWKDPKVWPKSNPLYPDSPTAAFMEREFTKAINEGYESEVQFKTKNLSIWTKTHATWITDEDWVLEETDMEDFEYSHDKVWLGLDLSKSEDLSSMAVLIPPPPGEYETGMFRVVMYNWCPRDNAEARDQKDGTSYMEWNRDGWLTLTPGEVIDQRFIEGQIRDIIKKTDVQVLEFDPYNSTYLTSNLEDTGVAMSEFTQNARNYNEPMNFLETLVAQDRIDHGNNPVLRWALSNVVIKRDYNGNRKPDKEKSQDKIDPVAALLMAIGGFITDRGENEYDADQVLAR